MFRFLGLISLLCFFAACVHQRESNRLKREADIERVEIMAVPWLDASPVSAEAADLQRALREKDTTKPFRFYAQVLDDSATSELKKCIKTLKPNGKKPAGEGYENVRIVGFIYRQDNQKDSFIVQADHSIFINQLRFLPNELFMDFLLNHIPAPYKEFYEIVNELEGAAKPKKK